MYDKASSDKKMITREFLKKYLSYAKSLKHPDLTSEAIEFASGSYSAIRAKAFADGDAAQVPVTVRTLEALIRLSTAHAKMRLSKTVDTSDVQTALMLLNNSIFNISVEDKDDDNENTEDVHRAQKAKGKSASKKPMMKKDDDMSDDDEHVKLRQSARKRMHLSEDDESKPNKRQKTDPKDEVDKLFGAKPIATEPISTGLMRKVFNIIREKKDKEDKIKVENLMAAIIQHPEIKNEIQTEEKLLDVIHMLDSKNMVSYIHADKMIVLI